MFGEMPAYGFFIRHVKGLEMSGIDISFMKEDLRPPFVLNDVKDADFNFIDAEKSSGVPEYVLKNVDSLSIFRCRQLPDTTLQHADNSTL